MRRAVFAVTVASIVSWGLSAPALADAFLYLAPFHPEECEAAIQAAQHARRFGATTDCDMELLAEGLYCRGLQDDPVALGAAIGWLQRVIAARPDDVYARMLLASAIHRRAPWSPQVGELIEEATALLPAARLGAAHDATAQWLAHNAAAQRAAAVTAAAFLQELTSSGRGARTASADSVAKLVWLGPEWVAVAGELLTRQMADSVASDTGRAALRFAETISSASSDAELRTLYRHALEVLCSSPNRDCALARVRLRQLDMVADVTCAVPSEPQGGGADDHAGR